MARRNGRDETPGGPAPRLLNQPGGSFMGHKVISGFQRASFLLFIISQATAAAMMLTTSYDTIMRYFFARPTEWSVELNEVLMVFITLLAAPELVKRGHHIQMDLLYSRLSGGAQKRARVTTLFIGLLFCACIFWYGLQTTITSYISKIYAAGAFRMPFWVLYSLIPLGMLLMSVEFFLQLIGELRGPGEREEGA